MNSKLDLVVECQSDNSGKRVGSALPSRQCWPDYCTGEHLIIHAQTLARVWTLLYMLCSTIGVRASLFWDSCQTIFIGAQYNLPPRHVCCSLQWTCHIVPAGEHLHIHAQTLARVWTLLYMLCSTISIAAKRLFWNSDLSTLWHCVWVCSLLDQFSILVLVSKTDAHFSGYSDVIQLKYTCGTCLIQSTFLFMLI